MSDLISRANAIDEIREVYEREFPTASGAFDEFVVTIIPNILRNMPDAEPERTAKVQRHLYGRTIDYYFDGVCECGYCVDSLWQYCPNCGAKLDWSKE